MGLPRSNVKITVREGAERFAAKMSIKLLVVLVGGTTLGLAGALVNLIIAIVEHRLINAEICGRDSSIRLCGALLCLPRVPQAQKRVPWRHHDVGRSGPSQHCS
jgi:hypothetical protein